MCNILLNLPRRVCVNCNQDCLMLLEYLLNKCCIIILEYWNILIWYQDICWTSVCKAWQHVMWSCYRFLARFFFVFAVVAFEILAITDCLTHVDSSLWNWTCVIKVYPQGILTEKIHNVGYSQAGKSCSYSKVKAFDPKVLHFVCTLIYLCLI